MEMGPSKLAKDTFNVLSWCIAGENSLVNLLGFDVLTR